MHRPVMLAETLAGLHPRPGSRIVDATLGGGGHALAILQAMEGNGTLLGLDRDPQAIARCRARLAQGTAQVILRQADFAEMENVARECGMTEVDGVLMDLGVSSFQLEDPQRGFSFQQPGPLDMRMDPESGPSAAEIVNEYSERELAGILWSLGEERRARVIAHAIVRERRAEPIQDTGRLAAIIERAKGGRRGRLHPATKSFMALRMAVNQELDSLEAGLEQGLNLLRAGGRMAVIAFHSMEDRLVKKFFKAHAGHEKSLQAGGSRWEGECPPVKLINKKPITAAAGEIRENPRARSAKLRVAERSE